MLKFFLSEFKCYRRKKGGKWYLIYDEDSVSGFASGGVEYWTQTLPEENSEIFIINMEDYSSRNIPPAIG